MKPVEFEGQDVLLKPPPNMPRGSCGQLPVKVFEGCLVSYWKPSAAELAQLNAGELVRVSIMGERQPPVSIAVERVVELP